MANYPKQLKRLIDSRKRWHFDPATSHFEILRKKEKALSSMVLFFSFSLLSKLENLLHPMTLTGVATIFILLFLIWCLFEGWRTHKLISYVVLHNKDTLQQSIEELSEK